MLLCAGPLLFSGGNKLDQPMELPKVTLEKDCLCTDSKSHKSGRDDKDQSSINEMSHGLLSLSAARLE